MVSVALVEWPVASGQWPAEELRIRLAQCLLDAGGQRAGLRHALDATIATQKLGQEAGIGVGDALQSVELNGVVIDSAFPALGPSHEQERILAARSFHPAAKRIFGAADKETAAGSKWLKNREPVGGWLTLCFFRCAIGRQVSCFAELLRWKHVGA